MFLINVLHPAFKCILMCYQIQHHFHSSSPPSLIRLPPPRPFPQISRTGPLVSSGMGMSRFSTVAILFFWKEDQVAFKLVNVTLDDLWNLITRLAWLVKLETPPPPPPPWSLVRHQEITVCDGITSQHKQKMVVVVWWWWQRRWRRDRQNFSGKISHD